MSRQLGCDRAINGLGVGWGGWLDRDAGFERACAVAVLEVEAAILFRAVETVTMRGGETVVQCLIRLSRRGSFGDPGMHQSTLRNEHGVRERKFGRHDGGSQDGTARISCINLDL